jgi:hypothetical protein
MASAVPQDRSISASPHRFRVNYLPEATMSPHEELIRRYEQGVSLVDEALRDVPEAMLDHVPAPGKWTIRQIAAHLADSELVISARLRWIAAEPGSPLKAFDQDKWARSLGYQHQSPQDLVELMRSLRRTTATMLRSLPESAWAHTGRHEERGDVSLRQMVDSYSGHAEHHAQQIRELRSRFA